MTNYAFLWKKSTYWKNEKDKNRIMGTTSWCIAAALLLSSCGQNQSASFQINGKDQIAAPAADFNDKSELVNNTEDALADKSQNPEDSDFQDAEELKDHLIDEGLIEEKDITNEKIDETISVIDDKIEKKEGSDEELKVLQKVSDILTEHQEEHSKTETEASGTSDSDIVDTIDNPDNNDIVISNNVSSEPLQSSQSESTSKSEEEPEAPTEPQTYAHSQSIVHENNKKVDILWVIDNSMSMLEEQEYLGANFSAFMDSLTAKNSDFQTAITSTDVCDATMPSALRDRSCPFDYGGNASTHLQGAFIGTDGTQILTHDNPNLISLFNDYTQIGVNGSNFEHGLYGTYLAVSKDLARSDNKLVRDDSFLSIIIVSDEEDDGIGLNKVDPYLGFNPTKEGLTSFSYSPDDIISYLNSIKGRGNFSISAITGVREKNGSLCKSAHSSPAEEGTAYIAAAEASGGVVQSICETDWGESLSQMGEDLSSQILQIALDKPAIESSIVVTIDGEESTHWSYIEGQNSIKFDKGYIPEDGQLINISYESLTP